MELWNDKVLACPPINAVKTRIQREDLFRLRCTLKHALSILESKNYLDREGAMLSRIIFRTKRRFRQHASKMFLGKVYRGLKRFFLMDVKEVFYSFEQSLMYALDDADASNFKSIELYLPTRQLLEYVLIRTQTFAKLMQYLATTCENAAVHLRVHISMGHLLRDYTLGFCIVSRIWYFSSYFVSCACSWYTELLRFRHVMKPLGANWLPHNYKFPVDLSVWLGRSALTGKLWRTKIDVEVNSAGPLVEKPSSVDLGEVISRSEYDASSFLQKTDHHTNAQGSMKRKRENDDETNCGEKLNKKIKVDTGNDEKNVVERDFHKLPEKTEINTNEVISRGEYDGSSFLHKTNTLTSPQGSMKTKKIRKNDETYHKGNQKKKKMKIKVETENDEKYIERRDLHELPEKSEIHTEVKLASPSFLNLSPFLAAVKSESEKSIAMKKKSRGKEEIIQSKKNKFASLAGSMVIGGRFKQKIRKKNSNIAR